MNYLVFAAATICHLIPIPFGLSPMGAIALYSGAHAPARTSWLLPAVPMCLGLLISGFYQPVVMAAVLMGYMLATLPGKFLLQGKRKPWRAAAAVVVGALLFFIVSNFAVWLVGYYPSTAAGLVSCYVAGLPFLALALMVDGLYLLAMLAAHDLMTAKTREVGAS